MLTDKDIEILTRVMKGTVEPVEKRLYALEERVSGLQEVVTAIDKKIEDRSTEIIDTIIRVMDETHDKQESRFRVIEDRLGISHKH